MQPLIKICCIASVTEARTAIDAGAAAIGLVAEMPSGPGVIEDSQIRDIARWCPDDIATFLLTSRTRADDVVAHLEHCGANTVQLVDAVTPDDHRQIKRALPHVTVVQVVHVQDDGAVDEARRHSETADVLLLDSGNPDGAVRELGGTGRVHNWEISGRIVEAVDCPVFLAGGLNPENVGEAVRTVRPYGVDICSGVRTDGRLDEEKLARYTQAVRMALS